MDNEVDVSPLSIWEHNHREATTVLADFAQHGDVDWEEVLFRQQTMLDQLLTTQDRRLSRKRRPLRN